MTKLDFKKKLGHEYIADDEDRIIEEMVTELQAQMDSMYADKKMLRQIHTKMHGCVKAEFIVDPNLDPTLKVGVFKMPKTYNAWVRFSNANTTPKADKKKDIRGIAIKLMGVPGDKILNREIVHETQDFLLMSSETFFSKNISEFSKILKASTSKNKLKLVSYFLNPLHWGLLKRLVKSQIKCDNPLNICYWSTQPYQFGSSNKAVKYFLKPVPENRIVNENLTDVHYLRINMSQTLYNNDIEFDFYIQFQTDAESMPIEDPTIEWTSQFIKVATVKISAQEFDTAEQTEFGENLSFNSWHTLPEHRPLGSFNRARKRVYEAMSNYRHAKNGIVVQEPGDSKDFLLHRYTPGLTTIEEEIPKKGVLKKVARVLVECDKATAFNFISSIEHLPNWLKKSGPIPASLGATKMQDSYDKVGDKRNVLFEGEDSVVEELMTFNPYANYSYSVTAFSNFLRYFSAKAYGQVWFDTVDGQTRISWEYSFSYKNLLAKGFLSLFLTLLYKKFMVKALKNAKDYIENGD